MTAWLGRLGKPVHWTTCRILSRAEFWTGVGTILFAKWLYFTPSDLTVRPSYSLAVAVMTDARWEWWGFVSGLMQVAGVVLYHRWLRFVAALGVGGFWLSLAWFVFWADPSAPAIAAFLALGFANVAVLVRSPNERG